MSTCPKCGYELAPLELECPRCRREESEQSVLAHLPPDLLGVSREAERPPSRAELAADGATSGAIYGALTLCVLMLVDRYVFHSAARDAVGLVQLLCFSATGGVVSGALVGLAVALQGSPLAGIVVGALLLGIGRGMGFSGTGFGGGFSGVSLVYGLVYGAIFGWAVAVTVITALRKPR